MATYDTSMPPDTGRSPRLGAYDIRQLASAIQEIENIDHYWPLTGSQVTHADKGKHRKAIFIVNYSSGSFLAKMLAALTSGELGYENNSSDSVVQLTRSGNVNLNASVIANNTAIKADNNAGDGTVDLIKLTTGDIAQLPDKSVLAGSTAPTVDAGIANKKYVDDKHIATGTYQPDGSTVFNTTMTTANTFQDLDLSSYVGSNTALVFLEIKASAQGPYCAKPKGYGSTAVKHYSGAGNDMGGSSFHPEGANEYCYMIMATDNSGCIQHAASNTTTTYTVKLVGYIK